MSRGTRGPATRVRWGVVAFILMAGIVGRALGWSAHLWAIWAYFAVIFAGLMTVTGIEWAKGRRNGFGPEDLDRPGGPYDRLHHRVK